ncbi:phage major capsid protein [Streptomyces erythrochromogenes]|uniref:phage major capsid protein n=1 Tax=Streptomyces erythrochromogenes TaxID=285574 RepID=UPI0036CBA08C
MTATQLTRLVTEQNTLWQRMQEIQAAAESGDRDWSAEERTNWDAAEARLTEVSRDIERIQRMTALSTVDRSQLITTGGAGDERGAEDEAELYRSAFSRYTRNGMERMSHEQRELLMGNFTEVRAQSTGSDPAGGYLVPDEFRNTMTETMKSFGGILSLANVITTATGNDLNWPTNDDTANEGALLSENSQISEQDVTIGRRTMKAHTFTSKLVRVSLQLLNDSAFPLETWLAGKLGERIGRSASGYFATGTGIDQPEGITTYATVGKTGAGGQTTSIIYDDLVDLEHSVDPAYRSQGRYLMNDAMLKVIRKLKDSQSRPLWVPVPAPGFPSTINGFEYTIDNKMPVPAASAKSVIFGDIKAGYIIRQVQGVQMMRLAERYADYLQVGFFGFARLDAQVDDASAIRAYQHPAS